MVEVCEFCHSETCILDIIPVPDTRAICNCVATREPIVYMDDSDRPFDSAGENARVAGLARATPYPSSGSTPRSSLRRGDSRAYAHNRADSRAGKKCSLLQPRNTKISRREIHFSAKASGDVYVRLPLTNHRVACRHRLECQTSQNMLKTSPFPTKSH